MAGSPPGSGASSGFLEFFILEAADYVEQLDGLLLSAARTNSPDASSLQRASRALRGAATMARLPSFAELAASMERVGRALQGGQAEWGPALSGALVATVDDFKILLRSARNWTPADDARASTRSTELAQFAPVGDPSSAPATSGATGASANFLSTEATNVAAGLELLAARSGDAGTAVTVLRRVRALRGVAAIKEIGPLADVLEATEDAAKGLEFGEELNAEGRRLLEAAGSYLRVIARGIARGIAQGAPAPGTGSSPEHAAFETALDNWSSHTRAGDDVVPIEQLFYEGTAGVVESSASPPTSPDERFRLELVSLGEHLRQVVDTARIAQDPESAGRARRDLKRAVRAAQAAALSFGEFEIAGFIESHFDAGEHIDFLGLSTLENLARTLTGPGSDLAGMKSRVRELVAERERANGIASGFAPLPKATPRSFTPRSGTPVSVLAVDTPPHGTPQPVVSEPTPDVVDPVDLVAAAPIVQEPVPPTPELVFLSEPGEAPAEPELIPIEALAPQPVELESSIHETSIHETSIPEPIVPESILPAPGVPVASIPEPSVLEPGIPQAGIPEASVPEPGIPEPRVPEASVPEPSVVALSAAPEPTFTPPIMTPAAAVIETTIAALDALDDAPFIDPVALPEDDLVPIEGLLYKGRSALDRALELKDTLRQDAGVPSRDALQELFDLLELARAEQ